MKPFNEHETNLHEAIEDPIERQGAIDSAILQDAFSGNRGDQQRLIAEEVVR